VVFFLKNNTVVAPMAESRENLGLWPLMFDDMRELQIQGMQYQ